MPPKVKDYLIILIKAHPTCTDLWQYTSTYREKPNIHFIGQWIVQVNTDASPVAKMWSSYNGINRLLQDDTLTPLNSEISIPIVKVSEIFYSKGCNFICFYLFKKIFAVV